MQGVGEGMKYGKRAKIQARYKRKRGHRPNYSNRIASPYLHLLTPRGYFFTVTVIVVVVTIVARGALTVLNFVIAGGVNVDVASSIHEHISIGSSYQTHD